jgi:hypothetical protein
VKTRGESGGTAVRQSCARTKVTRSIARSGSQVEEGGRGHEEASKRPVSVRAMSPATRRRDATPPPDLTRDKG